MATPKPDPPVPKAFISYSWDDDAHKEWVKQLATRLRADRVDVTLDRWHSAPGDQIPAFMEHAVRENDFVIAICTPRFKERSDERGGGVGYEGDIMTAYAFNKSGDKQKKKFIPVLRRGRWEEVAPVWLLGRAKIDLSGDPYSESEYEELLRTLHGAREEAPPIGHRPNFGDKRGAPAPVTPLVGSSTPQHQSSVTPPQVEEHKMMETVVYGDLVGSTSSELSTVEKVFVEANITVDRSKVTYGNTWGDAFCLVFKSPIDAVRFALEIRDKVHWCDWRAKGISRPPRFRIAIDTGEAGYNYDRIRDSPTGKGPVFVEVARLEPITPPGRISTTEVVRSLIKRSSSASEFFFEEDREAQELAEKHINKKIFQVHNSKEAEAVREGRLGPLLDEQHYRREESLRRFALLWLVLDQLPMGSWGRSVPGWMGEVWKDGPKISRNPHIEEEGGFETTILNMQLLYHLIGESMLNEKIGDRAVRYLENHCEHNGFGTVAMSRDATRVIETRPRHTALVGWLLGCVLKDKSLWRHDLRNMFRFAATSLLNHDPGEIQKAWEADRNPMMLYLAAWHTAHEVGSAEWSGHFETSVRDRIIGAWEAVEPRLRTQALAHRYGHKDGKPHSLAEKKGTLVYPMITPYGQFIRMESYTLLTAASLIHTDMNKEIISRISLGIEFIICQYSKKFGGPEDRYTREPLRAHTGRGPLPYYANDPEAHPDLGTAAMLFRILRSSAIREAIWPTGPPDKDEMERIRYYLGEDLVEQFDRYLLNPRLYALTNAGMFASLLMGDNTVLNRQVVDACREVIDNPPENELKDDTIDKVLSERKLEEYITWIVARHPGAGDEDPGIQLASRSLARLLLDRVRPGRYVTIPPMQLTSRGRKEIEKMTTDRTSDESFCDRFNEVWGNNPDQVILGPFLHLLSPHASVLDLGCGPGQYALEFARRGHEVTLLDVSPPFLRIAEDRLRGKGYKATTIRANVLDEDDRWRVLINYNMSKSFEGLWCSGLFVHVPKGQERALLKWIRRLLKDQGFLFVNVMINNSVLIARDGRYFTYYGSEAEFEAILESCGFRTEFVLRRRINRNTYGDPFFSTTWANFCVQKLPMKTTPPGGDGLLAALLTSQAYEQSVQAFRRIHSTDAEIASRRIKLINEELDKVQSYLNQSDHKSGSISLLDAGCGPGDYTLEAARRGWNAVGVDISSEMIFSARRALGCDLRLMSSLNDVHSIPTKGKSLIIVAAVKNVLHVRIFDGDGKVVVDTDEKRLTEQARQLDDFKKQLESLWPLHELTRCDKDRVITAVTSIVDHTRALPQLTDAQQKCVMFHVRDIHRLPNDWTGRFDAVLCVTAMQHIPRGRKDEGLKAVLKNFHRVLRLGGILRTDVRLGLESGFDPDLRYIEAISDKCEIINILDGEGFEILDEKRVTLNPGRNTFQRPIKIDYIVFWARKVLHSDEGN